MTILLLLIPVTLAMGTVGLGAFFWAMRHDQFDDPDGDARRILQTEDRPLPPRHRTDREVAR
ncbi:MULTISPECIES: cbb3-type cytochrome oxidase assembly protein CcoS [Mameliella]|uniref:FixS protein n=1 Tax=Mameliella alba TaxID=561184 RepID=A0A0B3RTK6_9RHOB|nr:MULTISPECIES: cbb3-type cytochrome oxidase assembly protein CcoS [Mameliella]KHQ50098.1 FixS protein [Mameliella alba]